MLGQSRVATVKGRVEGKALGVKAKARAKVTKKFNEAVDKPLAAAKAKAGKGKKGAAAGKKQQAGGSNKGKKGGMGLFGKNKGDDGGRAAVEDVYSDDAKTAMVDISGLQAESGQDGVGWVVPTCFCCDENNIP